MYMSYWPSAAVEEIAREYGLVSKKGDTMPFSDCDAGMWWDISGDKGAKEAFLSDPRLKWWRGDARNMGRVKARVPGTAGKVARYE